MTQVEIQVVASGAGRSLQANSMGRVSGVKDKTGGVVACGYYQLSSGAFRKDQLVDEMSQLASHLEAPAQEAPRTEIHTVRLFTCNLTLGAREIKEGIASWD